MRKLFTLLAIFIGLQQTYAQKDGDWCGAQPSREFYDLLNSMPENQRLGLTNKDQTQNAYLVPLKIHITGKDDSTGFLRTQQIFDLVCDLNKRYLTAGIRFYVKDAFNYIRNSTFYNLPSKTIGETMMSIYNVPNQVNVYFVDLSSQGLCGYAYFPNSGPGSPANKQGGMVEGINGSCSSLNSTTWTHEMGHYFSLYHTFQTTSNAPAGISGERITRNFSEPSPRYSANCNSAGDGFCDTPSDFIGTRWACPYTGNQTDINGDLFVLDAANYMNYANDNCQNYFTPQQRGRMGSIVTTSRNYLLTSPPVMDTVIGAPTAYMPADQSTGVSANYIRFNWSPVQGAKRYHLRISRFATFSSLNFDTIVSDTSFLYTGQLIQRYSSVWLLKSNTNYFWSVKAVNDVSFCSGYSNSNFFTTGWSLGTKENDLDAAMVYPTVLTNGDRININLAKPSFSPVTIELFDLTGRLMTKSSSISTTATLSPFDPNVSKSGVYLLRITADNKVTNAKIIIQ